MGKCPHCGSRNIRRRYREHRRYKWRCRRCNRVFRAPKRGGMLWLIVVPIVMVTAIIFAVQQNMISLPPALSPIERQIDRAAETVMPNSTPIAPVATLTTTLHSAATSVANDVPKVQATIDANVRSAVNTVSTAISETPTPASALVPTSAPSVTPTLELTITPTPMPTLTPTVTSTPTPLPSPHLRHLEEKNYMLELINEAREDAGVPPVELGDNIAAQLHAEAALENCFSSHWGIDGLKPYMRYSLAGGYQSNGENGHGSDYCITGSDRYKAIENIEWEIKDAMEGWMGSSGHRRNILDKYHKRVNLGLAWDKYNFLAYQHFEGDSVKYEELPSISTEGTLSFSGTTKNDLSFRSKRDLGVQIYYDRSTHELTRGQVSRTYCYDSGRQVGALREPLTGGSYWTEDEFTKVYNPCPDPYNISPDAPAPRSHNEASAFWKQAYQASRNREDETIVVPWITASSWTASGESFSATADISDVLEEHGNGVYTIVVWGKIDREDAVISEYSIFHGITPPDTYTPR